MRLFSFFKLFLLTLCFVFSQESSREIGLGGSMVTLSRGVNSVGINPANLAYSRPSMSLINFNSYLYNNLISLEIYNNLNGYDLENENTPLSKNEFLDLLGDNSLDFNTGINFQIPGINFSNEKYAVTSRLRQFVEVKTGNGLIKTVFLGNEWGKEITIEMQFTSHTILEYGLSLWHEFEGFSVGYTMKYLQGINLFKLYSDPQSEPLYTDSTGLNLNYMLRRELYPGGSGYALDLGFITKESNSGWSLGFSIINMFGYVNWDKHNINYALFGKKITKYTGLPAYKSEVIGFEINNLDATDLMSGSIEISDTVISDTSFSEDLNYPIYKSDYPSILRFGLSKVIEKKLQIAIESTFPNVILTAEVVLYPI